MNKRKLRAIDTNAPRSALMQTLAHASKENARCESIVRDALADFRYIPQAAWETIFQTAFLMLDNRQAACSVLTYLLYIKSGLHTAAALDEANERLGDAALAVACADHSPLLYAIYTVASLSISSPAPPRPILVDEQERRSVWPAPFALPPFVSIKQSAGRLPYSLDAAAEALCSAIEKNMTIAAVQAAFAIVAAGEMHGVVLGCDRSVDIRGTRYMAFFKSFVSPHKFPAKLTAKTSFRAEILVPLIVAAYAQRRGLNNLVALCLAVVGSIRHANYYSPYAMASALASMVIVNAIDDDDTGLQIHNPTPPNDALYPSMDNLEPEDRVLGATTIVDPQTGDSALAWIAASSFGRPETISTLQFANRLTQILEPAWETFFK